MIVGHSISDFVKSLENNRQLKIIDLQTNLLEDEISLMFIEIIQKNIFIEAILLDHNQSIPQKYIDKIEAEMLKNKLIKKYILEPTHFDYRAIQREPEPEKADDKKIVDFHDINLSCLTFKDAGFITKFIKVNVG